LTKKVEVELKPNFEQGSREGKQQLVGFEDSLLPLIRLERELLVFSDDDFMFKKGEKQIETPNFHSK